MKRKRGRPVSSNPATERIFLRLRPEEKAAAVDAAKKAGLSVSEWIRRSALQEVQ